MKDHERHLSDTNSADNSGGKTWSLVRDLFWIIVDGVSCWS